LFQPDTFTRVEKYANEAETVSVFYFSFISPCATGLIERRCNCCLMHDSLLSQESQITSSHVLNGDSLAVRSLLWHIIRHWQVNFSTNLISSYV